MLIDLRDYSQTDQYVLRLMLRRLFTILEKKGLLHLLSNSDCDFWVADKAVLERERKEYQS